MKPHPLLLPIIITQGLWVRYKTPRLPEAPGARSGKLNNGKPTLSLLVLGDSSAAGVGAAHQDQALLGQLLQQLGQHYDVNYRLEAFNGATTADMLEHIQTIDRPFDLVVTALGVNDVKDRVPVSLWIEQTQQLIQQIKQRCKPHTIVISGVPPMGNFPALPKTLGRFIGGIAAQFEQALLELVAQQQVAHINFQIELPPEAMASDGFHPGPPIYQWWAEQVVEQYLARQNQN